MATFSHSKLSTFEQCKAKYKLRYIDKIKPEIDKSIESLLGTCVHETLEWLYLRVKDKRTPTLDEIIIYYSNNWKANFNPNIPIVKPNLTPRDYFNKGVQFLINYYTEHKPFADNTIHVEKAFIIDIKELEGHKIRGFIDRIALNIEKNEIEVHDYKTSNTLPTQEKINNDRQLGLYAIAIKELFGNNKEIKLIWHYLSFNKKIISRRTDEQLTNLKEKTRELIKQIEDTINFPPNKSVLCNWCEYKSICPAWQKPDYKFEKQEQL